MSVRHASAAHQLTRRRLLSGILASTGALALLSACGSTVIATATTTAGTATQSAGSPTITASSQTAAAASGATQSMVATTASSAVPQPASAAPTRAANAVVFWTCAQYPYKGQIGVQFVTEFEQQGGPTIQYQDTIYKDLMTKLVTTVAAQMPAFLNANPLNKLEVDLSPASKTWISAVGAKNLDAIENTMVADVLNGKQTPHDALSSASASMQAAMTEAQKSCVL
jgi:hypothetical protein